MSLKLTVDEQSEVLWFLTETLNAFESQTDDWKAQNLEIYEALSTFTEPHTWDNFPRFKENLMHIILRQVVPRIIAKSPKPIVSVRTDSFFEWDDKAEGKDREAVLERNNKFAKAMQDYLMVVFEQENFRERLKYWVVNQLTYWNAFAQIVPKYKIKRSKDGKTKKITEKVIDVLPTLDVISFSEMLFDPRYKIMEDMPWYARTKEWVRIRDLIFATDSEWKKKYFNLDKVEKLGNTKYLSSSSYKQLIQDVTGVAWVSLKSGIDKNSLTLQTYYWLYSLTEEAKDERLYEITSVNNAVVIWMQEITEMPILDIKGHEDPEIYLSVGLLAPIMGIQDEINYQKNSRALAVSKSLNRSYMRAADSGIDPSQLVWGKGWDIIYAANWLEQAKRGFEEIADRPLDNSYFSDINDLNRSAQRLSHTTDVTQPQGQTNLTNTATGAKISFFESNSVIAELRKNFERGVQELWMKILEWTFDNIDKDITLKRIDDWKFFRVNKEAFRDALERYEIKIEANSSSFDDTESRRDDAIALNNISREAAQAGVPVDLIETFKKVVWTFENINPEELLQEQDIAQEIIWGTAGWELPEERSSEAATITESVTGWNLTEWL